MLQSDRYHYTECGLDNIYLVNGFTVVETPRGGGVQINNIEGLHEAIGSMLVREKQNLSGKEFRFLRHELNMTQQTLALLLRVDVQSVAGWEKGLRKVPGAAQCVIRLLYEEHIKGNPAIREPLERLAELDEIMHGDDEVTFVPTANGWQPSMAAA